jgi:3,4-dihydroxy 2-butanone 4-phosphate synthase/GTP cyclohydrolase II
VLERAGQTEAAVDVARLAGLTPAGVLCEVLNDDGCVARFADLVGFCARHDLGLVTIADLIGYRRQHDRLVERVVDTALPTDFGDFVAIGYRSLVDDNHHVALVKGDVAGKGDVLVGVHTGCVAGDVFRSRGCDCGERLQATLTEIERAGQGVLVYLTQGEPRGVLHDELRPCDDAIAAQIVADLGVSTDSWGRRTQELVHGHS